MLETGDLQISVSLSVADGGRAVLWRTTKDVLGWAAGRGGTGTAKAARPAGGWRRRGQEGRVYSGGHPRPAKDRCVWVYLGEAAGRTKEYARLGKGSLRDERKQIKTYVLSPFTVLFK